MKKYVQGNRCFIMQILLSLYTLSFQSDNWKMKSLYMNTLLKDNKIQVSKVQDCSSFTKCTFVVLYHVCNIEPFKRFFQWVSMLLKYRIASFQFSRCVIFIYILLRAYNFYSSHTYTTVSMAITSKDFSITGKLGAS